MTTIFSRNVPSICFGGLRALTVALSLSSLAMIAQAGPANPVAKLYVAGTEGGASVMTFGKIVPVSLKDIFPAQGAQIDTKPNGNLTMVFSNGTGAFLDHGTHLEVRNFTQESFQASRTDLEREPSVSHTGIFIPYGTLAVSTSKLALGSTLVFITELGSFTLHDGNLVIEAGPTSIKFFLLAGEGTATGRNLGTGDQFVRAGQQVVITPGAAGQPVTLQFGKIPTGDLPALEVLVERAYAARRTVFFQTDEGNEIVPVTVVPASLPVEAAVSPSKLPN